MNFLNNQAIQYIPTENFPLHFQNYLASISNYYFEEFKRFIQKMAHTDDTWRFWVQFVFEDAMAYISLFLALRGVASSKPKINGLSVYCI